MAAHQVEQFSRTLKERDVEQLYGEAEAFARRQPGVFLGGAVVLGFLAARFLKSSAQGSMNRSGYQGGSSGQWDQSRSSGYGMSSTPQTGPTTREAGSGGQYGGTPTPVGAASRSASERDHGLSPAEPNGRRDPSEARVPGGYPDYPSNGPRIMNPAD
jgi:hypothetical protein